MRIDVKYNIEMNNMILNLNRNKFINKQMKEEEIKELIVKLNLFNVTRKEYITIEQLLNNLKDININTSTHELIDLNSIDDNKTVIIYRFY
ncbi:hypothetical protein [Clostridium celatum]|uniref:hypothetical protein n=1 Tax=Clostridium celatum TaxID=36834 RepID=UPI002902E15A|nr:hypothetical protein [Clostridium celatum]MDU2265457.1 hypothetical protein [Clostridium celatum]MDU6295187.1 hypothetical protein [Clostridium celatum]